MRCPIGRARRPPHQVIYDGIRTTKLRDKILRGLRRRRWLWLAVGLVIILAWHFEAASRLDRAALDPVPGPLVLDRPGRILRLGPEAEGRKLVTLPPGELPGKVVAAFVAAEDQRFWRHPGIDPLAILRALEQPEPRAHRVRGLHHHPATGPPHLPRAPQLLSQAGGDGAAASGLS